MPLPRFSRGRLKRRRIAGPPRVLPGRGPCRPAGSPQRLSTAFATWRQDKPGREGGGLDNT